ncbi:MAG: S-layer homology domain-containing protein, partial [Clostridiales bacterium]|nr:S-layer homology domain-containing protein [Clostridiales bacterium]
APPVPADTSAAGAKRHTIAASAKTGGAIEPSGNVSVAAGASQTFKITPKAGYSISSVTVDGKSVGAAGEYQFKNVAGDHSISAAFKKDSPARAGRGEAQSGANGGDNANGGASAAPDATAYEFPFADVQEGDWFYGDVLNAYRLGLINGVSATRYAPGNSITVAETIKLAACAHRLANTGSAGFAQGAEGEPWYSPYVAYALDAAIIVGEYEDYGAYITREEFAFIFFRAGSGTGSGASLGADAGGYEPINSVADGAIPDVAADNPRANEIYALYRAGVLAGSDAAGTFNLKASILRSEAAAILSRVYDPEARVSVTLN